MELSYSNSMNIALYLTLLRIMLIPVFVFFFYFPLDFGREIAAIIFAFASITDWLDGFLARRLGMHTDLGAFLDPVADKLLVVFALVLVAVDVNQLLVTIPICIILCRELLIASLRQWMAEIGKSAGLKVSFVAKVKTTIQMIAILMLLYFPSTLANWGYVAALIAMYFAVILTLWSMMKYMKVALPDLTTLRKK